MLIQVQGQKLRDMVLVEASIVFSMEGPDIESHLVIPFHQPTL